MAFCQKSYHEINRQIDKLLKSKDSSHKSVQIVAASKQQAPETIIEAIEAGIVVFGENKVQEAEAKWPDIKQKHPNITLQMIGSLQSNKAEDAVALFDEILTLDRESLAVALKKAMEKLIVGRPNRAADDTKQSPEAAVLRAVGSETHHVHHNEHGIKKGKRPELMIQVNTGEEPQKGGILPAEADDFITHCKDELALPIVGLMCVPPADDYPAPHFALLATIAGRHNLKRLSMGMSGDFETAIRMGATEIRLGTVLFGARG